MRERRGTSGDLRLLAGNHEAEAELYPWHKYYHLIVIRAVTEYLLTLSSCKEFGVTALISPWNFFHWGYQVLEIGLRLELYIITIGIWLKSKHKNFGTEFEEVQRLGGIGYCDLCTWYIYDIYDSVEDMGRSVIFQQNSEFYSHLLQCPFIFSQNFHLQDMDWLSNDWECTRRWDKGYDTVQS